METTQTCDWVEDNFYLIFVFASSRYFYKLCFKGLSVFFVFIWAGDFLLFVVTRFCHEWDLAGKQEEKRGNDYDYNYWMKWGKWREIEKEREKEEIRQQSYTFYLFGLLASLNMSSIC